MVGGLATSFLMELLVYPAIYLLWKRREIGAAGTQPPPSEAATAA
jgi:Cu(I)/Ag(I) efflux system membrane protein CusA/SilA